MIRHQRAIPKPKKRLLLVPEKIKRVKLRFTHEISRGIWPDGSDGTEEMAEVDEEVDKDEDDGEKKGNKVTPATGESAG